MNDARHPFDRLAAHLAAPVDASGLAAFRFLYGALVALGSARFLDSGWPEKLYGAPSFFFRFALFEWIPPVDAASARVCYVAFIVLGIGIAVGLWHRLCAAAFVVLFSWVQLTDVTNYLNHYWLVILLGALLAIVPASETGSVDAARAGRRHGTVPRAAVVVLRAQVAFVYIFAAVAKVGPDWLAYGQPLGLWLPPRSSLPLIGPLLVVPWVSLVLSWCGFLYDATIVPLLLWRRSRVVAYALVVVFHGLTRAFFEIGMFPFIMMVATTLFFSPSWPRDLLRRRSGEHVGEPALDRSSSKLFDRAIAVLVIAFVALQLALPLRTFVLSDNVLWDETGMRWSWRVMVREKSGSLSYRASFLDGDARRTVFVSPHDWLTWRQANEMIGQPDLILQLAHAIRDQLEGRGYSDVQVRADCTISLNGRPAALFIDPNVDLAKESGCLWCRPTWVMPAPTSSPPSPWRSLGSSP